MVNGGGVGVSGEGVAVDISHLSPLDCHPNSGLQGHPGGKLHPAATCPTLLAVTAAFEMTETGEQVGLAADYEMAKEWRSKGQAGTQRPADTDRRIDGQKDRQADRSKQADGQTGQAQ